MTNSGTSRRQFLRSTSAGLMASASILTSGAFAKDPDVAGSRRVAVIGHTGRGNYGHGLDTVWKKIPAAQICAVADANATGLKKELGKLGVERGFTDYQKMLTEVQPEFVSVCPRYADERHDMALAAIEAGVKGLYLEKPFCRSPAEADSLIAACKANHATIAVAHRNRYHPTLKQIDKLIQRGRLGRLLEIRGRGKGDRRGGGEDLWVLGSHVMNLIQYFAGEPKSCSAIMLQDGRRVTADDVKPGAEGLGPLAADEVHARYETASGVVAYYDSVANDGTELNAYCMQLIGSQGMVTLHIDKTPLAHFTEGNPFEPPAKPRAWIPITTAGAGVPETRKSQIANVYNHVAAVQDLIDACDNQRKPLCDVRAGATTVEMICGVFESHRQGGAVVRFPLEQRLNGLSLM